MARFIEMIDGRNQAVVKNFNVDANQTILEGDPVEINATTGKLRAATTASTTLVGAANRAVTTGATVTAANNIGVTFFKNSVHRFPYIGTTKTSLTEADLYTKKFDLSNKAINLDTATGGQFVAIAYNNTNKTVDVVATSGLIV